MSRVKSGFTQKKYFKLKDGPSTFRILPPMEELGNAGKGKDWSKFYKVHYGYKNTEGKLRVFQSTLVVNRKTKMIEVPDAADQRIKDLKARLESAKESGDKKATELLGKLVSGQKPMYNVDGNHYVNAIDSQGNIGVLKLRHRAMKALEDEIKKLEKKNVDPLALTNGREFVFTRSGTGLDTSFKVDVAQETLNIEGVGQVNRDKISNLSEDVLTRSANECADLSKLFKLVSPEDIERIVKTSDLATGISPVIDELFDKKGDTGDDGSGDAEGDEDSSSDDSAAQNAAAAAQAAAQAAKADAEAKARVEAQKAAAAEAARAAKAAAELAEKQAAAAAKTETKAAPRVETTSSSTTAEAVSEMSDADFLKNLGL